MIYDKIKIYVTNKVANVLKRDAESFEIFKADGMTPNKNALLTALIVNYAEEFRLKQQKLYDKVASSLLTATGLSEEGARELCRVIVEKVNREFSSDAVEKFDCLVSLKPTKESQPTIDFIEAYALNGLSLSEYFRNLFSSYASLPQDERERVIFKPVYDRLTEAINGRERVFIATRKPGRREGKESRKSEISPYSFARSKEELHLYLLASVGHDAPKTFRLSRILSVTPLGKRAEFSDREKVTFAKMTEYGPQFFYNVDAEEVTVLLTERGKQLFRVIYLHRPVPSRTEGDFYFFDCSHTQVLQYFERFGKEAVILSPKKLQEEAHRYYKEGERAYRKAMKGNETI